MNENPGSPFGATSLTALPIQPIYLNIGPNWQCCLAGSSKRAPRILIFLIAMDADDLSYVKFIATYGPAFFGYIISVLAMVGGNYRCTIIEGRYLPTEGFCFHTKKTLWVL